ncbi:MAG: tRNA pseudouridine(38-40) synthase TruA [Acidimicrobiales bacterium]
MSSSDPERATRRWRLDLAYDGRAFSGFAYQPRLETVAGALREVLARTLRLESEPVIVGAGRTDAGVHALHQVVHVDLPARPRTRQALEPERLVTSLNAQLRGRVHVIAATPVEDSFHARFSATWRAYRYLVCVDGPRLDALDALCWSVPGPLDLAAMNAAATATIGAHDFRSFCRRAPRSAPDDPITRLVLEARWRVVADPFDLVPEGRFVRLDIRAQSFCHTMVRSLVSTMVAIGRGRLAPETIAARLESPQRDRLPAPAPPAGLALVAVGYEEPAS